MNPVILTEEFVDPEGRTRDECIGIEVSIRDMLVKHMERFIIAEKLQGRNFPPGSYSIHVKVSLKCSFF